MGFMTPFMILNDGIHLLLDKKNQEKFCKDLYSAACNTHGHNTTISISGFCNPVTALPSLHADVPRIIYCGQNSFADIIDLSEKVEGTTSKQTLDWYEGIAREATYQAKILRQKVREQREKLKQKKA